MQCVYGKCYPTQLRMSLDSPLSSSSSAACDEFNIVDYYRQYLNIDYILSDDMILDFYAFESEDVKKGTNVSRLINTLRQLEIGDHVYPGYVSLFKMMYTCYIEEPLKFLKLQSDYNTLVAASSSAVVTAVPAPTGDCDDGIQQQQQQQQQQQCKRCRGRKRRNPSKIIDEYGQEKIRRQMWYDKQHQQQQQCRKESEEVDIMLQNILELLEPPRIPAQQQQQYGQYVKDISSCIIPSSPPHRAATTTADDDESLPPPPSSHHSRRRRRKSKSYYKKLNEYRHDLMMKNVIL